MHYAFPLARLCVTILILAGAQTAHATPEKVDQLIRTALMLDSHPQQGAKLYGKNCASCHGAQAEGNGSRGIPALAGQRHAYLIKQFADFSQQDRDSKAMHRVLQDKSLGDPQAWADLSAFINSLPPAKVLQHGNGAKVLLGEAIFREQCSSCHEEDARGDDDGFVPALRNQHYGYLLRQMQAFADGHRRNVDPDLDRFIASIKDDEMTATADFLSRLTGPIKDRTQMRQNGVVTD
jgi:cytochrome c553